MKQLIWDAHSCLPLHPDAKLNVLSRHLKAGFSFVSINIGMDFNPIEQIFTVLASFRRQIRESDFLIAATNVAAIKRAHATGKLAVAFDLEGALPLLNTPDMLELYWTLGVRQIHLAYNRNNNIAGGCHDEDQGLTQLGRSIVAEINRVGMLMDTSHMSYRSSMEIFELSSKPVIYSHANPRALRAHPRNITDEQIRGCAATGGVICINGVERFLNELKVDDFIRHLSYVAELVGAEHVGIGLDTMNQQEGIDDMPPALETALWWPPEHYKNGIGGMGYLQPEVMHELMEKLCLLGFSSSEQEGILGLNMLRAAKLSWKD
jgi:membrane dipeptidase